MIIHDVAARQLARTIALRDGCHIDNDKFVKCRQPYAAATRFSVE
jgi:hypothetical protein